MLDKIEELREMFKVYRDLDNMDIVLDLLELIEDDVDNDDIIDFMKVAHFPEICDIIRKNDLFIRKGVEIGKVSRLNRKTIFIDKKFKGSKIEEIEKYYPYYSIVYVNGIKGIE